MAFCFSHQEEKDSAAPEPEKKQNLHIFKFFFLRILLGVGLLVEVQQAGETVSSNASGIPRHA